MSSNLVWEPVVKQKENVLDDQLKFIFRKHYALPRVFDQSDIPYLTGLKDAGVIDADILIKAIEKHNQVNVQEKY